MRVILVITITLALFGTSTFGAKSRKKSKDDSASILNKKLVGKSHKQSPPAIIAIEIVDPNENKTKNSKRTIDSALGYGYQNFFSARPQPPKYEVYKYSQQDIPPYHGSSSNHYNSFANYDVQKSISYQLPSQQQQLQQPQYGLKYTNVEPNLSNHYQPGTTLFSTLNNQGQLGGLSTHVPQQYQNEPQVPVIILRIMPNQLNDPSAVLYPNLPQSHPLASTLNSINLQSLLNNYAQNSEQNYEQPQQQQQQQQVEDEGYRYDPPNYSQYIQQPEQPQDISSHYQTYSQPETQSHHSSSSSDDSTNELLTHENYPKNTHTRVIFHGAKKPAKEVKTIQVTVPHSFSEVQVEMPGAQYSYSNQGSNNDNNYYYQSAETGNDNQNQNYYYNHQPNVYENEDAHQNVQYQQENQYVPNQINEQYNYHQNLERKQRSKESTGRFTRRKSQNSAKALQNLEERT